MADIQRRVAVWKKTMRTVVMVPGERHRNTTTAIATTTKTNISAINTRPRIKRLHPHQEIPIRTTAGTATQTIIIRTITVMVRAAIRDATMAAGVRRRNATVITTITAKSTTILNRIAVAKMVPAAAMDRESMRPPIVRNARN